MAIDNQILNQTWEDQPKANIEDGLKAILTAILAALEEPAAAGSVGASALTQQLRDLINNAVPNTRTVNGKALSSNVTLGASDVGAMPATETVVKHINVNGQEAENNNGTVSITVEDGGEATPPDAEMSATSTNAVQNRVVKQYVDTGLAGKVDAEAGKSLMSDAEHTKLAGIAAGAEVNVQSDWNQTNTNADDYIKNKPTIPDTSTLATKQEMADAIDDALGEAQVTVVPANSVAIITSLGSDSNSDALAASMGKVLRNRINTIVARTYAISEEGTKIVFRRIDLGTPIVSISPSALNITTTHNTEKSENVSVLGFNIESDVTLSLVGTGLSFASGSVLTTKTISVADALAGINVPIYFDGAKSGGGQITAAVTGVQSVTIPITASVSAATPTMTLGKQINCNQGVGNECPMTLSDGSANLYDSCVISLVQGQSVDIVGVGGSSPRLWCVVDNSNIILSAAEAPPNTGDPANPFTATVTATAACKVIVNVRNDSPNGNNLYGNTNHIPYSVTVHY